MILAEKGATMTNVQPFKFDRIEQGKFIKVLKACFEIHAEDIFEL